jgi:hypothetical protein
VLIVALWAYLGGRGAARTAYLSLSGAGTAAFGVGATSGATAQYYAGTNAYLVNGGTTDFYVSMSGSIYFGKGGSGSVVSGIGHTWAGTLGGGASYVQCPSQCGTPVVTPSEDGTQATVTFSGPADNGGTAITGYVLQRADNSSFTIGLSTISSSGSSLITGLTPGKRYYWRATAKNAVTAATGATGGPWSGVAAVDQPDSSLGMILSADGSTWVKLGGKIRSADNTAFVDLDGRIRSADNTAWLALGAI